MPAEDLEDRLERVEAQHADYIRVLSSHTSAIAANTASLAAGQQVLGQLVADVAVVRRDVSDIASRMESLQAFLAIEAQRRRSPITEISRAAGPVL